MSPEISRTLSDLGRSNRAPSSQIDQPLVRHARRLALGALVLLWLFGLSRLWDDWHQESKRYLDTQVAAIDTSYRAAINMYRLAASTRMQQILGNEDAIGALARLALNPSGDEAATLRGQLYQALHPLYQQMRKEQFRQFHLHTPRGDSLLRFHEPTLHGDPLLLIRPAVREAMRHQQPRFGFEVGAVLAGYRYVYPLSRGETPLGSVEFGIPFRALRDAMADLDTYREYAILLRKDVVSQHVQVSRAEMYGPSGLSDMFVVEDPRATLPDSLPPPSPAVQAVNAKLRAMANVQEAILGSEPSAFSLLHGGEYWVVILQPIRDLVGQPQAVMVSYARNNSLHTSLVNHAIYGVIYTLLAALLGGLLWRLFKVGEVMLAERGLLKTLTDHMTDGLLATDESGRVLMVNPALMTMSGHDRADDLGAWGARIFANAKAHGEAGLPEACKRMIVADGKVFEAHLHKTDGEPLWVEMSSQPYMESGRPSGTVTVVHDVTERRRMEEELRLAAHVFEHNADGVMITDADSRILRVNRTFSNITGYTEDQVLGKTPTLLKANHVTADQYKQMWVALKHAGHWHGEFLNSRPDGTNYWISTTVSTVTDQEGRVNYYVSVFRDVTEQRHLADQMEHQAHHDALTGLANRAQLRADMEAALTRSREHEYMGGLACLYLDLDGFKHINDTLGHSFGDLLLNEVARRLQRSVRTGDTVYRIGGDEFLILMEVIAVPSQAEAVARKVLNTLAEEFRIRNADLHVSCSIGISLAPSDGTDYETLMRFADLAMYHAKNSGRNIYKFYTSQLQARVIERVELGNALHGALERTEFYVHYQPQCLAGKHDWVGAEALVRWRHPNRGVISPALFIPIAEEVGLIAQIGLWVLREACRQLTEWRLQGLPLKYIAVNLSIRQLEGVDFPDRVAAILAESALSPYDLELEITESAIMEQADRMILVLAQLHQMGVRLSIDDFGTGYSSLAYIKRFPLHRLKIDQSFVRDITTDPNDLAISQAIIALSRSLDLEVVAEGVETRDQAAVLEREGCQMLQGYLFGKPMTAKAFAEAWHDTVNQAVSTLDINPPGLG